MTGRPYKLLLAITSSDGGGAEKVARDLLLGLDRFSFEPTLLSLRPPGRIAHELQAAGVPVVSFYMSKRATPVELAPAVVRLALLIRQSRFQLVQSFLYRANILTPLAVALSRSDAITVSSQRSLDPLTGRATVLLSRVTHRRADRIVAVSQAVKDHLVHSEHLDPDKICVVPNGVDVDAYRRIDRSAARKRLGIAGDRFTIGAAGRLTPVKGLSHLLLALRELAQAGQTLDLYVAGDGPEHQSLSQLALDLGLEDSVTFLGDLPSMNEFYSSIDAFVLPSLREGSPNVVLEAMATGCPVIASRVGGVPEILTHQETGLMVDPADSSSLAAAIRLLVSRPEMGRSLSTAARAKVERHFDFRRVIESYEQFYRSLLVRD